jgi:glycosyltransferase involved in cell wall biosynthesis
MESFTQRRKLCFVVTAEFAVRAFLLTHIRTLSKFYDITLVVNTKNVNFLKDLGVNVEVLCIPLERRINFLKDIKTLYQLYFFFKNSNFWCIHTLTPKAGLLSLISAKFANVPFKVHTFTGQVWITKRFFWKYLLKSADKIIASLANFIIVDSPSQEAFLIKQKIVEAKKSYVFGLGSISGVDIKRFFPSKTNKNKVRFDLGIPKKAFVFIFLGRLNKDKGVLDLLEAFSKLNLDHTYMLIVGPDEEGIVSQSKSSSKISLDRVRFINYTSAPENFIQASDVICLPSYREGFGSSVIEAAAAGLPSVVSRIYGLTDAVIEGKTGLMHEPGNISEIKNTLHLISTHKILYQKLAINAKERAIKYFNNNYISQHWSNFYADNIGFSHISFKLHPKKNVAILMATFNGENFIKEQLDSIAAQTYTHWKLFVSDDGSTDATLNILKSYQKIWGKDKLKILKGPRQGFQKNFMSLITSKKVYADFYMLCDQDDIWLPQKISTAIKYLQTQDPTKPQLYCGRTTYVSEKLNFLQYSQLFNKPPSFKNALVQSIAGGNTMAFNNVLKDVARKLLKVEIVSHDWWLYILNELSGGYTYFDKTSFILYRQHKNSLIGGNTGYFAKLKRLVLLLNGRFRSYNDTHLNALKTASTKLANPLAVKIIDQFYNNRHKGLLIRLRMLKDLKIYRQTWDGQIALYIAMILKRL